MANELSNALTQLNTLVDAISGFNTEPTSPPTQFTEFPFYVIEPDTGIITLKASSITAVHTVSIQIHLGLPATITPSDKSASLPYVDLLKDALLLTAVQSARLAGTVDAILADDGNPLTYDYGLIGYRGVPTIGWEFLLRLKIRSVESGGAFAKG